MYNSIMKREDRRPGISGLDDIECSNYLRGLFKHDGLFYYVKDILARGADKGDYFEDDVLVEVEESKVHRVIGIIENKLREELGEYADSLEKSKEAVDNYIDGLLDAHGVPAFDPD